MKLILKNISKSFGSTIALKQVGFELGQGEIHAVCGENGAGKTTLMNILSGNFQPDEGEIYLNEQIIIIKNQETALELGIATVYQHLSLFDHLSVAENIFANHLPVNKWGFIDTRTLHQKTNAILKELKIDHIQASTLIGDLSLGQKQLIEIARALVKNPTLLILDEPTAAISSPETNILFEILLRLKKEGTSIIYISHRLEEIFRISDRVTVLKDGQLAGTVRTGEIDKESLIYLMVGRHIEPLNTANHVRDEDLLEVIDLNNNYLKSIGFKINSGETVALGGLAGEGRQEITQTIFGFIRLKSGKIVINGKAVRLDSTGAAIRYQMAYIPEDRRSLGLFPEMSITENIASCHLYSKNWFYDRKKLAGLAQGYVKQLNIKTEHVNKKAGLLSGGNQQKLLLAKWFSTNPQLFLIDEPTHGVDIGSKWDIYQLLKEFTRQGKAVLISSSELKEILSISDRVLVIKRGSIKKELITIHTTEAEIVKWAL